MQITQSKYVAAVTVGLVITLFAGCGSKKKSGDSSGTSDTGSSVEDNHQPDGSQDPVDEDREGARSKSNAQNTVPEEKARENIKKSFGMYKNALLNKNGEMASEYVSESTIEFYGFLRKKAISASEQETRNLDVFRKLMVLLIRHRLSYDRLSKMTGKDIFVYAVNRGWIGRKSVRRLTLNEISVQGDRAKAGVSKKGKEVPAKYAFVREKDGWKFDLLADLEATNKSMKNIIKKRGMNENRYLIHLLQKSTGRAPDADIWKPLDK